MIKLLHKIIIPGPPETTTAQQKGECIEYRWAAGGKRAPYISHFIKPEVQAAKDRIMAACWDHKPTEPHKGALRLDIVYYYPIGSKAKKYIGAYKITKPDNDNMLKGYQDCLGDLDFFLNDAQIAITHAEKYYTEDENARTEILIYSLEDVIS